MALRRQAAYYQSGKQDSSRFPALTLSEGDIVTFRSAKVVSIDTALSRSEKQLTPATKSSLPRRSVVFVAYLADQLTKIPRHLGGKPELLAGKGCLKIIVLACNARLAWRSSALPYFLSPTMGCPMPAKNARGFGSFCPLRDRLPAGRSPSFAAALGTPSATAFPFWDRMWSRRREPCSRPGRS